MRKIFFLVCIVLGLLVIPFVNSSAKDFSKYTDGEVFLISDKDWKDVLHWVPVTVWDESGTIHKYPFLIYHDESDVYTSPNYASVIEYSEVDISAWMHNYGVGNVCNGNIVNCDQCYSGQAYEGTTHHIFNVLTPGGEWLGKSCRSYNVDTDISGIADCSGADDYYEDYPAYIILDLGYQRNFNRINLRTRYKGSVEIFGSNSISDIHSASAATSGTWISLTNGPVDPDSHFGLEHFSFNQQNYRYLKFELSTNSQYQTWYSGGKGFYASLSDIKVFNTNVNANFGSNSLDIDSIVYFLQMYDPSKITIIANDGEFESSCSDGSDNDGDGDADLDDVDCQLLTILNDPGDYGVGGCVDAIVNCKDDISDNGCYTPNEGSQTTEWYDSDGPNWDCDYAGTDTYSCGWAEGTSGGDGAGGYENFGLTGNEACCHCGGGQGGGGNQAINIVNSEDYLTYWGYYSDTVESSDDYGTALVAASYASLINAPLIFADDGCAGDEDCDTHEYCDNGMCLPETDIGDPFSCGGYTCYEDGDVFTDYCLDSISVPPLCGECMDDDWCGAQSPGSTCQYGVECGYGGGTCNECTSISSGGKVPNREGVVYSREEITVENKKILVGDNKNCPGDSICTSYTLSELQEAYIAATGTDKVLVTTPADLNADTSDPDVIYTDVSGNIIQFLYTKLSLAAPYLAAARHEVIILENSGKLDLNYGGDSQIAAKARIDSVDSNIQNNIANLFSSNPYYLTIFAAPNYIPNAEKLSVSNWFNYCPDGETTLIYDNRDADYNRYADMPTGPHLKVGRIYGFTPSDTSSYVARSVFYDELISNEYGTDYTGLIGTDDHQATWQQKQEIRGIMSQGKYALDSYYDDLDCFWKPRYSKGTNSDDSDGDVFYLNETISASATEIPVFMINIGEDCGDDICYDDFPSWDSETVNNAYWVDEYRYVLLLSSKIYEGGQFRDYGTEELVGCNEIVNAGGQYKFIDCTRGIDRHNFQTSPVIHEYNSIGTSVCARNVAFQYGHQAADEGEICTWVTPFYGKECGPSYAQIHPRPYPDLNREDFIYDTSTIGFGYDSAYNWPIVKPEKLKNKQFIAIGDHGGFYALNGIFLRSTYQRMRYDLSYIFAGGCSSSLFERGQEETLAPWAVRRGMMGYHGALDDSGLPIKWLQSICYMTIGEDKTLGELNSFVVGEPQRTSRKYGLLGDPALTLRFPNNVDWGNCIDSIVGNTVCPTGQINECDSMLLSGGMVVEEDMSRCCALVEGYSEQRGCASGTCPFEAECETDADCSEGMTCDTNINPAACVHETAIGDEFSCGGMYCIEDGDEFMDYCLDSISVPPLCGECLDAEWCEATTPGSNCNEDNQCV